MCPQRCCEGETCRSRADDQDTHGFCFQNLKLTRPPKARPVPS
jgi:hypothetical protein